MTAALALTRRALLHSARDVETLLMAIMLPLMMLLLFTYVFGASLAPSTSEYLNYVVPGIALVCAGFGAASTAVSVARDMNEGLMDRFRTIDMPRSAVVGGHVVASLARNLVATTLVVLVALLLGFEPSANPLQWLAVLGMVALYVLAITTVFAAIGIAAGSVEAASGYGFILLFLPYLSSAFVPVETMPGWLQAFAAHQPITHVTDSLRELMHGTWPGTTGIVAMVWCVGLIGVGFAAAAFAFSRSATHRRT